MTWFRIDDSFYDHPKVFDAPDCAVALWTRAGTWSARNLTDGFVPAGMPARLCDDPDTAVKELTRRGLWKRTTGGFLFHDWTDFQPTAEAVKSLREQRAAAGRRGGQAKAALASGKQPSSKSQASASAVDKQNAAPARPDPAFEGGALGDPPTPHAGEAPPPRCPEHLNNPTDGPCGPCGTARRARTRWDLADSERRRTAPQCPKHRGQPATNCGLCRADQLAAEEEA
jgi:hypothetical protein